MTREEFENYLSGFNKETLSTDDLYNIGVMHKEVQLGQRNWTELNEKLDYPFGNGEQYRSWIKQRQKQNGTLKTVASGVNLERLELQQERIKIRDERLQLNAYIRDLGRRDTVSEIANDCASKIAKEHPFVFNVTKKKDENGETVGVLLIGDWHYGEECNDFNSIYNPEEAAKRVKNLTEQTIEKGKKNGINTLYVINLSDLISGAIHLRLRLETRENTMDQVMHVAELVSQMLYTLSQHFNIKYYSCLDNHSRLDPNKADSLPAESFVRIIDWYLKTRFADAKNVEICTNALNEEIGTFEVYNHHYAFVHGHNDKPTKVASNLTMMTKRCYDVICLAHYHHFNTDEQNETVVVSNGSLMGNNNYANSLRLSSKATQVFFTITPDCPIEAIYRLVLN